MIDKTMIFGLFVLLSSKYYIPSFCFVPIYYNEHTDGYTNSL